MESLFRAFHDAGRELFLVGGAVRDLAMGASYQDLDDLDFCTDARPAESLEILRRANFRTYDVGIEFGTVGAVLKGKSSEGYPKDVQVTTYRSKEMYSRGSRHPVVSYGNSVEEDLWRRDFSINSIAMDARGNYVDPYNGRGDIERGILRAVGDPLERLTEDPLRILRIARFMARLGFKTDPGLERAAHVKATFLLDIARQRWLQEMNKLLIGEHAPAALDFLARTRALGVILPELVALVELPRRCPAGPVHEDFWALTCARVKRAGDNKVLSWAALLADVGRPWTRHVDPPIEGIDGPTLAGLSASAYPQEPFPGTSVTFHNHAAMAGLMAKGLGRRFHFDTATLDEVAFVLGSQRAALAYSADWADPDVRRFVQEMSGHHAHVIAFGRILQRDPAEGAGGADLDDLEARIAALAARGALVPEVPTGLGGALMKAFGLKPGPILGELVELLKEEMLDGRVGFGLEAADYIAHLRSVRPDLIAG